MGGEHPPPDPGAEALDWLLRLQAEGDDPEVVRAFNAWCAADPSHPAAFETVTALWGSPELHDAARRLDEQAPLASRRGVSRRLVVAAAASFAAVAAVGALRLPDIRIRLEADHISGTGERRHVTLPDGSTMTLDAVSAVALNFADGRREVRLLEGAAFFDVRPDAARPFRVEASFGRVEVVGTAFEVRREDGADQITLARGKVMVDRIAAPSDRQALEPGQTVEVTRDAVSAPESADVARAAAWMDGWLRFRDRPLGQVVDRLRAYRSGRIVLLGDGLARTRVSGDYRLDQPDVALRSLAAAAGATLTELPGGFALLR